MTNITKHLTALSKSPLSVIVRTDSESNAWKIITSSIAAGVQFIEITLTVPNAYQLITKAKQDFPNHAIGAGTVLTMTQVKAALAAGADYLVSPVYSHEILEWTLKKDILYIPGVLTPNEMYQAYHDGAKLLKLYPATSLTPEVLTLIIKPFPDFKILATGGINLTNMEQYMTAVLAVGITDALGGSDSNTTKEELITLAKQYMTKLQTIITKRG